MEDEKEADFNGRQEVVRCERTGTNSTFGQVQVKCVGNESMLAAESVTNTAGQQQGALFWLLSDQQQGREESERGLFVQSETDEMTPSSARYSPSTATKGYFKGASGGEAVG